MKRCKKLLIFALAFWGAAHFCASQTDGFSVAGIDMASGPAVEDQDPQEAVVRRLSQPFHYWGKGGQSFVFLSEDGKTVLKFFKKNHPLPDPFLTFADKLLPSFLHTYRLRYFQTREERFRTIFSSCRLAYEKLRSETALLYLHLNPTPGKLAPLTLVDNLGCRHRIDIGSAAFLLQERAELFLPRFKQQIAEGDLEGAKRSLRSILEHLASQSKKGVRDTDNALKRNYGFIGDAPVSIDVGSFILDPSLQDRAMRAKELFRKTRRIRKLLKSRCPALLDDYKEMFEEISQSC